MSDVHVKQFTGSACASRNCAAASGAMAVAFAGGPQLSADQFRKLSGVSCTPGVDTTSGGLRSVDVWRVARSFGVDINYGGANGAVTDWPATALEARLRIGQGAIVLGDAKDAPINPSSNVVYHSAWVHGFRVTSTGTKQTHWHDPRNTGASWQSIAGVIRYWQGMDHGLRFAGFVVPNQTQPPPDTGTEPPAPPEDPRTMIGAKHFGPPLGTVTLGVGHQLISPVNTAQRFGPWPDPLVLNVYDRISLRSYPGRVPTDIDGSVPPSGGRGEVWVVDNLNFDDMALALVEDCGPLVPAVPDVNAAYNQGLDAAAMAVAREPRR